MKKTLYTLIGLDNNGDEFTRTTYKCSLAEIKALVKILNDDPEYEDDSFGFEVTLVKDYKKDFNDAKKAADTHHEEMLEDERNRMEQEAQDRKRRTQETLPSISTFDLVEELKKRKVSA